MLDKKPEVMRKKTENGKLNDKKEEFLRLLDEKMALEKNPELDFGTICRSLRACPSDLDEALREELGMGGRELILDRRSCLQN